MRRCAGILAVALLTALVVLLGWAAAVAAFFAAATVFDTVAWLFVAAIIVGLLVAVGGALLAARITRRPHPGRYVGAVGAVATVLLVLLGSSTVLRPLPSMPASRQPQTPPTGLKYWQLSTGSRVAYLKAPAVQTVTSPNTPIVLVGGGPGEADVADQDHMRFFARFTRLGYDVYTYDQVGAGFSERLVDPTAYTVRRHVADLEAIREQIGASRMILMGASWGASLVASYLARYPDHVAQAVFTSPAPTD